MSDAISSILPGNLPELERQVESLEQRITDLDIPIDTLWNPWECPAVVLPYLAWAVSVDVWEPDWPEETKRAAIAAAPNLHRIKGTPLAVKTALNTLGLEYEYREWMQKQPLGVPGTFDVDVFVGAGGITPGVVSTIHKSIQRNKRATAHYTLTMNLSASAALYHASAVQVFVELQGQPYEPVLDAISADEYSGSTVQVISHIEGQPFL